MGMSERSVFSALPALSLDRLQSSPPDRGRLPAE